MTPQPSGEELRAAIRWLSEERTMRPQVDRSQLIDEAARRFDLGPMQVEFLYQTWGRPDGQPDGRGAPGVGSGGGPGPGG